MSGCGVDGSAMRAYAGNISDLGQSVEVKDTDVPGRARASDIKIAAFRVGGHIVEAAVAADQLNLEHLVGAIFLSGCAAR